MANYLVLETVKKHINIDFDDDDDYINILLDVVENAVEIEIGEDLSGLEDNDGNLPLRLIHAMEILIAHFYLVREPVTLGVSAVDVPFTFQWLIHPFRNFTIK
jgi:uncharacterized phage protein (predicted DNA packaging)